MHVLTVFGRLALALSLFAGVTAVSAQNPDASLRDQATAILSALDDRKLTVEEQLKNYAEDAVILPPNEAEIRGHEAIKEHLRGFGQGVDLTTKHQIVEFSTVGNMVIIQGKVTGEARPDDDPQSYAFETKNIILLRRNEADRLKIWKVIYNAASTRDADNGRADASAEEPPRQTNAFERFEGVWTLKDDKFEQVWDGSTVETLTIPNHITRCAPVNTDKSILCVVDAGGLEGHILWVQDDVSGAFQHLSHFGTARLGSGKGLVDDQGNLRSQIRFADEPDGTYRVYEYRWLSDDAYEMMSRQFDADGVPTGNWYGGTFIRMPSN